MRLRGITALVARVCVTLVLLASGSASPVSRRLDTIRAGSAPNGDASFILGNTTYLANVRHPEAMLRFSRAQNGSQCEDLVPFTVISVNRTSVTRSLLESIVSSYAAGDDVFSRDFLEGVYVTFNGSGTPSMDSTGLAYLRSLSPSSIFLDTAFSASVSRLGSNSSLTFISPARGSSLPAGPYLASVTSNSVAFNTVYRLYTDTYRNFLYGTYDSNDGADTFNSVDITDSSQRAQMIPVPSRIYSWSDPRPLAGARVAIKDLFDMKGLITSGGSLAWAEVTPPAAVTAPSLQRIVDLGGVLVGKYKLAQFASGANPWNWQDEHYPWNPRGDEYLTCSASSSGGGCSIAAYPWLDFAIGTDTGSSMRRPGAVSGTYSNRPSQGMINMENVLPLGTATDTAGVFARDPRQWSHFAKNWYDTKLRQDPSLTGLPPLDVPDTNKFPKRAIYLTDYLPMVNPEAEALLTSFLASLTKTFNMKLEKTSFGALVKNSTPNINTLGAVTGPIATITQYNAVGKPLMEKWAALYDGRYPPVDSSHRDWVRFNTTRYSQAAYDAAIATRRAGVEWFERNVLYSTEESCSESILVWDIGTGGLPSFREADLIQNHPGASFLATVPDRAVMSGAKICPVYGCVDMTLPIGQVRYLSNVTFHEEYMPVTVSIIAKRGCDFMLWNMWEKLADAGVLKTVKTGRTAF